MKNSIHPPDCFMPPLPPDPAAAPPPVVGASPARAAALRKAQPEAVPLAIWDFDGTLFEGDGSEGFSSMDKEEVPGLVQGAGEAGLSPWYPAAGGFDRCWQDYRSIMQRDGVAAACVHIVRIFAGTPEAALRDLAVREFSGRLRPWFFAGALELWRELEAGGVRCVVISASADFFIKGAAGVLGVPANRLPGLRPATAGDGILTPAPVEPLTIGPGKAALLRQVLDHRGTGWPGGSHAVAAPGNDFFTDGPMLEAVTSARLPGGILVGALVNTPPPASHADRLTAITFARRRS